MAKRWENPKNRADSDDERRNVATKRHAKFQFHHCRLTWILEIHRMQLFLETRERDEGQLNGTLPFREHGETIEGVGEEIQFRRVTTNRISCNPEAIGVCGNCDRAYGTKTNNFCAFIVWTRCA